MLGNDPGSRRRTGDPGSAMSHAAVLITGAPGSGKTSVAAALGTLLEREEVAYGGIETDQLSWGWPWLSLPECLVQLRALVGLQLEVGRHLLLVVATTETATELESVLEAVAAERTLVVCLSAPADVLAQRVSEREPDDWPGKAPLVAHARELAEVIPRLGGIDHVLSTADRLPGDVAGEVRQLMAAHLSLSLGGQGRLRT